jgi:hypothetical protein
MRGESVTSKMQEAVKAEEGKHPDNMLAELTGDPHGKPTSTE